MNKIDFVYNNNSFAYYKNNHRLSRIELSKMTFKPINPKNVCVYKVKNNIVINNDGQAYVISDLSKFLKDPNIYSQFKDKIATVLKEKSLKTMPKKKVNRKKSYAGVLKVSSVVATSILAAIVLTQPVEKNIENLYTQEEIREVVNNKAISQENTMIEQTPYFNLEYSSRLNDPAYIFTKANYEDKINFYADKYGLDRNLMLAVATQESSGRHNETANNSYSGIGLMQIEYQVYVNECLNGYKLNNEGNFDKVQYQITDQNIRNIDSNIEIGCIVMQNCLEYTNYNIPLAIQMYNMGYSNVYSFVEDYANKTGKSVEEIINNNYDNGWLDYRSIGCGDSKYLEHILSYTDGNITCTNPYTNENINIEFNQNNQLQR